MDELIINLEEDIRINLPTGQEEAVINFSEDILVKVRQGSEVAVELTHQGPQGPQGELGDVTPAAIAARDTAIAAMDESQDARDETVLAAAAADADAAAAAQSFVDITAAIVALGLPGTHVASNFLRRNAGNTGFEYRTATQVRSDIGAAASVHAHVIADITSLQAALDSKGPKSLGPNNLSGGQSTYQALLNTGDDQTWKKIADITLGAGQYAAATIELEVRDLKSNHGSSSIVEPMLFYVTAYRSAAVQDDQNTGSVRGPADFVRLVKTATGAYEVQLRQMNGYNAIQAEGRVTHVNNGTVAWVTTLNAGVTTGTFYTFVATGGYLSAAERTKLTGIATGANNYAHPTGDGNLHVPATSTTNNAKFLKAGATAGSLSWQFVVKADVGLGNVDNTADTAKPISTAQQAALDLKAPLASPALTGTPTAPTAAAATNTTQIATTAFVKAAIDALLEGAPGALDTLNELAAAMGDDPNFATTVTNSLASKLAIADYTSASVLAKLLLVDGAGSGLDADLLDAQEGAFYRNAANLNAGTIADARLPGRLADAQSVTDWDTAIMPGFYSSSDTATNGPAADYFCGLVYARLSGVHCVQILTSTTGGAADTKTYMRIRTNSVWGAWFKLAQSMQELDARYTKQVDVASSIYRAALPANTNLNAVITAGTYFFDIAGNITTALNFPSTSRTGRLIVDKNAAGDHILQEYRDDSANTIWTRYSTNSGSTWASWNSVLNNGSWTAVSQANAEAGSSSTTYTWTPLRVRQAVAAYSHPKGMLSGGDQVVYTAAGSIAAADNGKIIIGNSATAFALTVPAPATLGVGFFAIVYNYGLGDLTLSTGGGTFDDNSTTVVLEQGHSMVLTSNGTTTRKLLRGGGQGGGGSVIPLRESIQGNGGAVYTLLNTPTSEDAMLLFVGGVVQGKDRFSLAGNVITLDGNVAADEKIEVMLLKGGANVVGVAPSWDIHTGNNTAGPFTLKTTPPSAECLLIVVGGVVQPKDGSAYTLAGNQITFTENIPTGVKWEETILQPVGINVPNPGSVGALEIKDADIAAIRAKLQIAMDGMPVGSVIFSPTGAVFPGYLALEGGTFAQATYPALYTYLGSTTLPDFRDRVARGAGTLAGAVGTTQEDAFQDHELRLRSGGTADGSPLSNNTTNNYPIPWGASGGVGQDNPAIGWNFTAADGTGTPRTAAETRVKAYVGKYLIKAFAAFIDEGAVNMASLAVEVVGKVDKANIVGALISGGNGRIIEAGNSANGDYVKFADGTMICYRNVVHSALATTVAHGSLFYSTIMTWTYPAAFVTTRVKPSVSGMSRSTATIGFVTPSQNLDTQTGTSLSYHVIGAISATADTSVWLMAVGRWF